MNPEEKNLEIIVGAVRHKYNAVADVDNALDNHLGVLLGFEAVVMIGYMAAGFKNMGEFSLTTAIMGIVLLGASVACLLTAQFSKKENYKYPFSVTEAMTYVQKPTKELLVYLINEGYTAINRNRRRRKNKKKLYSYAIRFLIVALPLLVLSRI